jgi:ribosome biogenesis SPOUT family RNA methylase Rps3
MRHVPGCMGHYDFDQITEFARKRFVEGIDTVSLMNQARSEREKEEIALVSMLDIENHQIRELKLSCAYDRKCKIITCRERLREMIEKDLARNKGNH